MKRPSTVCIDCWGEWLATFTKRDPDGTLVPFQEQPKQPHWRPAPYVGPRCATHHRIFTKCQKERAHDRWIQRAYGLGPGEYTQLYAFQDGRCAIPRCPARGVVRRLALDHNHKTLEPRGLLCHPHNRLIGQALDDPSVFEAIAEYLRNPPYRRMKGAQEQGVRQEPRPPADGAPEVNGGDPPSPGNAGQLHA